MEFLERFDANGENFLSKIDTGDETWVHRLETQKKRQSTGGIIRSHDKESYLRQLFLPERFFYQNVTLVPNLDWAVLWAKVNYSGASYFELFQFWMFQRSNAEFDKSLIRSSNDASKYELCAQW